MRASFPPCNSTAPLPRWTKIDGKGGALMIFRHSAQAFTAVAEAGHSTGTTLWQQFLVVATIVGFFAAVQQLWKWLRTRRLDRAQEEALRIIDRQLDAEGTRLKAEQYEQLLLTLRSQVEREVPRQARSAYLSNRVHALAASIARDFEEYEAAKRELAELANRPATELDASIANVVRREILPGLRSERRLQVLTVVTIGLVLVANVIPFNLYETTQRAFIYLHPVAWYSLADPISCLLWLACVQVVVLGVASYLLPTRLVAHPAASRLLVTMKRRRKFLASVGAMLGVSFLAAGLILGDISIKGRMSTGDSAGVSLSLAYAAWCLLLASSFMLAGSVVTALAGWVARRKKLSE